MIPYEEIRVPVAGGELAALRWPARDAGAPVVVALHGITANALSWAGVTGCSPAGSPWSPRTCGDGPAAPGCRAPTGSPPTRTTPPLWPAPSARTGWCSRGIRWALSWRPSRPCAIRTASAR